MNNFNIIHPKKAPVIYEVFRKHKTWYECLISPHESGFECSAFDVVCRKLAYPYFISFILTSSNDGHWVPDDTRLIDPWLADVIGQIILNNF